MLAEFGDTEGEKFQEATLPNGDEVLRISGQVVRCRGGHRGRRTRSPSRPDSSPGDVKVNTVGPSWGDDITGQARNSLIVFMVLVAIYIAWRLETKMAIAAIVAVIHDVIITDRRLLGLPDRGDPGNGHLVPHHPRLLAVRHDRGVRPRAGERDRDWAGPASTPITAIMRRSLNQVLMRSVNTTLVTILPVVSMLIVGQLRLRTEDARGLLARPADRPRLRHLLVAVRRRAADLVAQGARAPLRRDPQAPRRSRAST